MPVKAFLDYLSLEKKYSPHTVLAYKTDIEAFLKFLETGSSPANLSKVVYPEIRNWIVQLSNAKLSNNSINRKITALNSFYKFLVKIGELEINPLAKHRALKSKKKIQIPFSTTEIDQVLASQFKRFDFESTRDYLMIELFYATGIRRAELIHLKCSNVDLVNKQIKVVGKRNKERIIPLLACVVKSFNAYYLYRNNLSEIKDEQWVFLTRKGVKIYENLVYRTINSYFSKASTKVKKSPHILRHSFATHLLNEGANLNTVKTLLGHSSLASTQVYTHQNIEELKQVYSKAHPRSKS